MISPDAFSYKTFHWSGRGDSVLWNLRFGSYFHYCPDCRECHKATGLLSTMIFVTTRNPTFWVPRRKATGGNADTQA